MRTITENQWLALEDLSAQGLLGGLPVEIAEKDIHVTDLLAELASLQVRHRHFKGMNRGETSRVDDGISLVFAGGTCLSKAHRLISRMSEDIDIKVLLTPPTTELKPVISSKARLRALHEALQSLLVRMEFVVPASMNDESNPHVRDGHRYYVLQASYGKRAASTSALRPNLKLEVIHRQPKLPTQLLTFGYLHETLAGLEPVRSVSIPCIGIAETLAEKVLSLLRRCAWTWGGFQEGEMDPALVRHVYDVHRIMEAQPEALDRACSVFKALVEVDVIEFGKRDPAFHASPKSTLLETLAKAKTSEELQARYQDRLLPLIYAGSEVEYGTAFSAFETAASALLERL